MIHRRGIVALALLFAACGDDTAAPPDAAIPPDASAPPDLRELDSAMPDAATPDLATPDLATPDLAMPDLAMPDLAMPDLVPPLPAITAITPTSGPTTGGTSVSISGTGFRCGAAFVVKFGGQSATSSSCIDATRAQGTAPPRLGQIGPVDVTIINVDGTSATLPGAFRYYYGTVAFSSASVTVGATPLYVSAADANGDGKPDFAVANSGDATFGVALAQAGGGFVYTSTATGGVQPVSADFADLDGSGMPDLVVGDGSNRSVATFLNDGSGHFPTRKALVAIPSGGAVATCHPATLRTAGAVDVLCTSGSLWRLFGNGDGTLGTPLSVVATPGTPADFDVGDFNRDGFLDAVIDNTALSVALGKGDGSFGSTGAAPAPDTNSSVDVGDLDGDGKLDLVSNDVSIGAFNVYLGNGDGTFTHLVSYLTGKVGYLHGGLADLDLDGNLDVVVAGAPADTLTFYRGQGDGRFMAFANLAPLTLGGDPGRSLAIADYSGDGAPDVAVPIQGTNSVLVLTATPQ